MQAVHEMLLQSWSAHPGSGEPGTIRIFPATPWRWHDASFEDLRAEGGHRVSARRRNNATAWFRIVAGAAGKVRIRDNFGGRTPAWSAPGVAKDGGDYVVMLGKGEAVEASFPVPPNYPAAPPNVAAPVEIRTRN